MSVATVKARLASIEESITDVKRAHAQPPAALPAADLPAMVNFAGAAEHDWRILGSDSDQETRQYTLRLYIAPVGQGVPGEMERLCEPFFSSVRDTFAARPALEQLIGVIQATLLGDSGPVVMAYGKLQYIGIEFRLQVVELIGRMYDDYE